MAKRQTSADIAAEQEVIRAQALELAETEGTEEEVEQNLKRSKELLAEFDELEAKRQAALDYEKQVAAVRAKALDSRNLESGDGASGRGPEIMRRVDPWDKPVDMLTRSEARDRALKAVEQTRDEIVNDANRTRLDGFISRFSGSFDGDYIARRVLLTENDAYRSAFMKRMIWGNEAALSAEEAAAVVKFQEFEVQRAMSEGTTTAGGYGVPVKVAA